MRGTFSIPLVIGHLAIQIKLSLENQFWIEVARKVYHKDLVHLKDLWDTLGQHLSP